MILSIYYVVECQHRHLRADAATLRRLHHELATGLLCVNGTFTAGFLAGRPWGDDRRHINAMCAHAPRPTPHAHAPRPTPHAPSLTPRPFPLAPRPETLALPRPTPHPSPPQPAPPRRASPHPHRHAAIGCCMTSRALTPALALPLTRCFMVSTACFYSMLACIDRMLSSTQASYPYPMPLPLPLIACSPPPRPGLARP